MPFDIGFPNEGRLRGVNSIKRFNTLESERQVEVVSQRLKSNYRDIGPTKHSLLHIAGSGKPFTPTLAYAGK